ncbi:MAG: TetR/AcrR family transcriptional regulator, partial [Coriobacteriia bacterium]|nr:TetR/AcrR family transcriptional regulator [Coriobacteriia bacterium]
MAAKRLASDRTATILDGLMELIAAEGFASLKVSEMASRLKCSTGTLYRIAPSKESLVVSAIKRWADRSLAQIKAEAESAPTAVEIARRYHDATVRLSSQMSNVFRRDIGDYESTRRVYEGIYRSQIEQFTTYLDDAVRAGQIKAFNTRFVAMLFRQMGLVLGRPAELDEVGISHEEALDQVNSLLWEG